MKSLQIILLFFSYTINIYTQEDIWSSLTQPVLYCNGRDFLHSSVYEEYPTYSTDTLDVVTTEPTQSVPKRSAILLSPENIATLENEHPNLIITIVQKKFEDRPQVYQQEKRSVAQTMKSKTILIDENEDNWWRSKIYTCKRCKWGTDSSNCFKIHKKTDLCKKRLKKIYMRQNNEGCRDAISSSI
ncbi:MAG: hypothetical protein M1114_06775 [Candidatus Dependentiae bacterium]|nr:hypothetical protein [Candidatus Dependentiae bacterium]